MRRLVGPYWQVLRTRAPRAAERLDDVVRAGRGREPLVREVGALRTRLAELERDHLLLAAHVAALTERAAAPAAGHDAEQAVQRARLAAIAAYEQRIGALEERAAGRSALGHLSGRRTSGERGARVP